MFVELASLVQKAGKLSVTIFPGPDGRMKVCVAPSAEKGKELALATPLTLTATPQELDEGFAGAMATYQASRSSLAAQVDATATVLKEAEKSQSSKAVKALDKASKSSTTAAAPAVTGDDDDSDEGNDTSAGGDAGATEATAPAPAAAAATAGGTDLLSLI